VNLRNIIWNLLGLGLPLIIAVVTVPALLANIGAERFGFLGLAWGLVGYASILDLGMSRALTQKLAQNRHGPQEPQARAIVKSAVSLTLIVSALFMLGMFILAATGVERFITVQETPPREILLSVLILALTLPVQAVSMAYKGINEAYLNFRGISMVRIFLGVANFGAPCALSYFTVRVHLLVLTLLVARLCALVAYFALSRPCLPPPPAGQSARIDLHHTRALLQFGGWVAVSSVLAPIFTQADRMLIGTMVSLNAVTAYVLPYEMTTQCLVLVGAVTTIAFPAITQMIEYSEGQAQVVFKRWTIRVSIAMGIVLGLLFIAMPTLLNLWVGSLLDQSSIVIGRILCFGVFFNTIGAMFYSYLHALGRTKITAISHLIQAIPYIGLIFLLVSLYGEVGAAIACAVRVFIDSTFLILINLNVLKYFNKKLQKKAT
jgi:O-antigen/teichoic acid export membrane protein